MATEDALDVKRKSNEGSPEKRRPLIVKIEMTLANLFQDLYLFGSVLIARFMLRREINRQQQESANHNEAGKHRLQERLREKIAERKQRSNDASSEDS